jgi:hypothetical protein
MSSKVGPTLRSARNNNNNTPASAKASDAGAGSEVSDQQVSSSSPTASSAADAPPMSADMAYIASLPSYANSKCPVYLQNTGANAAADVADRSANTVLGRQADADSLVRSTGVTESSLVAVVTSDAGLADG